MIFINKKGRVAYVNKRCEEIMGYSRDEYYSENFNFLDLIAPECRDLVKENFKMHISGKDIPPYDYKIITKDGREITAIITTKLTDYEGEKAILGIITDITERKKAEEQLRKASNEWEATFNSINDLVSIHDKDFNLVKVNKAFSDTVKKKSDELIGKKCYEVVHGTNEPWPHCPHRQTMKIEKPFTEDFFEPKLGAYLQVSTSPICIEKGNLVGTVHIAKDITERKKTEEGLKESEKKYRLLFNDLINPITVYDLNGNIIVINNAGAKNLGRSPEELQGMSLYEIIPEAKDFIVETIHEIVESKQGIDNIESLIKLPSGEERWYLSNNQPLKDESGKIYAVQTISYDISERKKAEKAVLNIAKGVSATIGEKFFCSIVEHLAKILEADYAYVAEIIKEVPISARTLSLYANGNFIDNIEVDLSGTPCETIREKTCSYSSGVQKLFPHADMMAEMNVEGYVGTPLFNSSRKWIGIMVVMYRKPVENVSAVESTLQIFAARAAAELERRKSDETLEKAKDEIESWNRGLEERVKEKTEELVESQEQLFQAEKLSSLGQLAAGLAHELNSPLTGLISMIRHYRESAERDSEEYRHFALMFKACEHMAKIVQDFNTFSSKSKGEHIECNLAEIIESSLRLITNELKLKNIQITKEYRDKLPIVKGDKTELQQVALNIIRNAVDAMTDNGRLDIRTGVSQDKSNVMMEFIDNGSGIKKEDINKVFEPFFTSKPQGKGTGLGLSVSYAIIENHEGVIRIESKIGKGTKFTVLLPAVT
jgi:PAS domain S-box-containing protein